MRVLRTLLLVATAAVPLTLAPATAAQEAGRDGQLLVHSVAPDFESRRLEVVDVASGDSRLLTDDPDWIGSAISPDGRSVAGVVRNERVVVIDTVTAESRTVLDDPGASPTWSPDGTRLAVRLADREPSGVYSVPVDPAEGGEPRLLVADSALGEDCFGFGDADDFELHPSGWSPDGRELVLRSVVICSNLELNSNHIVELASGEVRRVADGCLGGAEWAPQGTHLAFEEDRISESTVRVDLIRRDGTDREALGAGGSLDFSPQGDRIAWVDQAEVVTRRLDGVALAGVLDGEWGAPARRVDWSPDGRALAVLAYDLELLDSTGDQLCVPGGGIPGPSFVTVADIDGGARHRLDLGDEVASVQWLGAPVEPTAAEPRVPPLDVDRVGGADRIATAVAVSAAAYPDGTAAAVLARGDDFPDALAGARVAAARGGPLLLAWPEELPEQTLAELRRLGVRAVTVLGGPAAIGTPVVAALEQAGIEVERIGGADRFETAALAGAGAASRRVLLVNGWSYADALAAGPVAAAFDIPVLLTDRSVLPESTRDAVREEPILVIGGQEAVSDEVATEAAFECSCVYQRTAGANRFETAVAVADLAALLGFPPDEVLLARGDAFPDALTAGPLGGLRQAPILFAPGPDELGAATTAELESRQPVLLRLEAIGSAAALSEATLEDARTAGD